MISNIGGWMYSVAAGWLMTSLDPDPFVVSMVQVSNNLPMFLFAIPAGALVDIVDRRRFLIVGESAIMLTSTAVRRARLAASHHTGQFVAVQLPRHRGFGDNSPRLAGCGSAARAQIRPPVGRGGEQCGINVSRAVGPALGGAAVGAFGISAPFWINGFSNIGVIAALIRWRPPRKSGTDLPPETFGNAVRVGIRHARYNAHLAATLIRAVGFFVFASAYWALLPLVARNQITGGGPSLYGIMLGTIGAAAVAGALPLRWLKAKLGADRLVAAATVATALATALFAIARDSTTAVAASLIAGASWIAAVSSLNVSAQVALPEWVRGRGLAVYVTVMFGALTLGSAIWGELAGLAGLPTALLLAAAGALIAIPLTRQYKLQTGANVDFSPSMHWAAPITIRTIEPDRGPVLVTIEYRIDPKNREPFLHALAQYARARRRDGAYDWGIFEDPAVEGRLVEIFFTDSWLEHLRTHQRVTKADRMLERNVRRFQLGEGPKITHLVGAQPRK